MDEVISSWSFHPGHPFLYLFVLVGVVAYFVAGIAFWRSLPRKLKWAWALGAMLVVLEIGVTVWVQSRLEWNPRVDHAAACGAWRGHGLSLDLRADQTFVAADVRGNWSLSGHALNLQPEPEGFRTPRFIRFGSTLRLREIAGDPDDWAGELGLSKVSDQCK